AHAFGARARPAGFPRPARRRRRARAVRGRSGAPARCRAGRRGQERRRPRRPRPPPPAPSTSAGQSRSPGTRAVSPAIGSFRRPPSSACLHHRARYWVVASGRCTSDRRRRARVRPAAPPSASTARLLGATRAAGGFTASMKVAIISDIHGNRQAFEAVLRDIVDASVAEVWCLGDLVGYGADPDACVDLARDNADVCLAGNHDLAVAGKIPLDDFSRGAALAVRWTQDVIAPVNREFLASLRPSGARAEIGLYHASPRDEVWEYVLSALLAELCFDSARHRVNLLGHSHVALSFER